MEHSKSPFAAHEFKVQTSDAIAPCAARTDGREHFSSILSAVELYEPARFNSQTGEDGRAVVTDILSRAGFAFFDCFRIRKNFNNYFDRDRVTRLFTLIGFVDFRQRGFGFLLQGPKTGSGFADVVAARRILFERLGWTFADKRDSDLNHRAPLFLLVKQPHVSYQGPYAILSFDVIEAAQLPRHSHRQ